MGYRISCLVMLVVVCCSPGCGKAGVPLGNVEGTVFMDEMPQAGLVVKFQLVSKKGRASYGETDENGHYRLEYTHEYDGALLGLHNVSVSSRRMVWNEDRGDYFGARETISNQYNINSELTREVLKGDNEFSFNLESDGSPTSSNAE